MSEKYGSNKAEFAQIDSHDGYQSYSIQSSSDEYLEDPVREKKVGRGTFLGILIFLFFAASFAYFGLDIQVVSDIEETEISDSNYQSLSLVVSNEYGVFSAPYPWITDDVHLIEPYRTSLLTLSGTVTTESDSGIYRWQIGYDTNSTYMTTAPYLEVTLDKTGTFRLSVEISSNVTHYPKEIYSAVYVKRELRSLTTEDRERFLDAAAEIWHHSSHEGKRKYGEMYTSIDTFVEEHAYASGDIMCDSYHEGSGFITHHLALAMSFEAAVRAVDPAATVPYWDFSIEGQEILDASEAPSYLLQISPFLSDEWFGSVDDNHHICDSRWANTSMSMASADSEISPNSYGFIRSYWNNNNDPYTTRHLFDVCGLESTHKKIPSCDTHYDVLNTANLASFQLLSPSDGHGPMHVQIGGIGGECTEAYQKFSEKWSSVLDANITEEELSSLGYSVLSWQWGLVAPRRKMVEQHVLGEYFHIYRSLWRSHMCSRDNTPNLLVCPDSCDLSTPMTQCKCSVESYLNGTTDWENVYPCILSSSNRRIFSAFFDDVFLIDLVTFVSSSSIVEGEMLESASPIDIIFWVIHPTIDRLLHAKRLSTVTDMAGTEFTKWSSVSGANESWYSYSYYSLNEGDNIFHPSSYTCVGHAKDDSVLPNKLPFTKGFLTKADLDGDDSITNWEFFLATDPNDVDLLDYVYDDFSWSHCRPDTSSKGPVTRRPAKVVTVSDIYGDDD